MSPYLGSLFPSSAGADKAREQGHGLALATSEDGQMALFAPRAVLTRDMEAALARGRFEEAGRVRLMIEATFGPSPDTRELGFLDRLGGRLWRCPPGVTLSVWTEIDADLRGRPHLRARLRTAFADSDLGSPGCPVRSSWLVALSPSGSCLRS